LKVDESRRLGEERLSRGDPAGAAAEFERGSHFLEASLAWERGGDPARAFENLLRVTPADTRYRQACVRAIRLAPARGPLSLGFENLVARFVKLGPENGEETEAFLALASLYEREGFVENATEALERVVARSPQHGAAQAALQRLRAPAPPPPPELPLDLPPPLERQRRQITPPKESRETQEEMPFRVGATIAGRYRLEEKIGAGGMSVVFRALDQQLNDDVAVKVFTQAVFDAESDGRLRRELSLSRLLSHPNIVQLFAIGLAFGFRYVTLELLRGVELASRMRGTALPLAEGLDYLMQACAGRQAAPDRGIVHRDVKPENCFILASGQLKLMDFGIAKVRDAAGLTATGMVAGTPAYMAPEQVLSFSSVTASADQYSLGIMAFEMFTAMRPFRHDEPVPLMMMHANEPPPPPRSINPSLPPELERIILRCLEKDPQRRYTSCRELRGELAAVRRSG
jgi:serine/threonine-protein kinase